MTSHTRSSPGEKKNSKDAHAETNNNLSETNYEHPKVSDVAAIDYRSGHFKIKKIGERFPHRNLLVFRGLLVTMSLLLLIGIAIFGFVSLSFELNENYREAASTKIRIAAENIRAS